MLDFGCTDLARSVPRLAWGMYTSPGEARERREKNPGVGPPVTPWKGETPQIFLEALRREMELAVLAGPGRAQKGQHPGPRREVEPGPGS